MLTPRPLLRSAPLAILMAGLLLCAPAVDAGSSRRGGVRSDQPHKPNPGPRPKVDRRMLDHKRQRPNDMVDVIVTYRMRPGSAERGKVSREGGQFRRHFKHVRGHAIRVPARALERLAQNADVEWISEDRQVGLAMDVARRVSSHPQFAPSLAEIGGAGVTIAVLDTGYLDHPETSVLASVDMLSGYDPMDGNGHGSHVAGIIAGSGGTSSGAYQGVAPAAALVSVRVLDEEGKGFASDVIAGLEWVIENKENYGIRVVNLSLGAPVNEAAETDPLVQAVEAAWDAGIVVVCSAGNNGRSGYGTITSPGNSPKVITVGSITDWNDRDPLEHRVSSYSSRGPTIGDLYMKPDLLAPGNRIVSTRAAGSELDQTQPSRRKSADGSSATEHFELSGTSMAAAVVSGAAALMLSADMAQVLVDGGRPQETVAVQANSPITYLANSGDPGVGSSWREAYFDDSSWAVGRYGIGYEKGDDSQNLHRTFVPRDSRSVFTRGVFTVDDPGQVRNLFFGADYDDGIVAWINGHEIYRSWNISSGDPGWSLSIDDHESSNASSPEHGQMTDVSNAALPYLVAGENVLAVAVYNDDSSSSDLVLVPRLVLNRTGMQFRTNSSDPGLGQQWTVESFDDTSWSEGSYGVGYDEDGSARDLLRTEVSSGVRSIYTRAQFSIEDVSSVEAVLLGLDYDDGAVAWINGFEVHRTASMPSGTPAWNAYPDSHESSNDDYPDYGTPADISTTALSALHEGINTLAIAVYNRGSSSSDLVLVPRLSIQRSRPAISPDTVKARLMRSAKKVFSGDPFTVGAGVLDISAAILDDGIVASAPSPRVYRDETTGQLGFDNTASTWGAQEWSLEALWSDGMVWTDGFIWNDAFIWSDGFMWSDDQMWSDGFAWNDSFIWSDGFIWNDAFVWSDGFIWNDSSLWEQDAIWTDGFVWSDAFVWSDSLPEDD